VSTAREIRGRIKSVKNTSKITRAMEMIAASKLRRARDRMEATRPYAQRAREIIGHLAKAHPEYKHPFMIERPAKRVGIIVVATDRGLCGGLNTNLFKRSVNEIKAWTEQGAQISLALIGHKAEQFFKRLNFDISAYAHHLGDAPKVKDLIGSVKVMLDAYNTGEIDRLLLISNQFINTISQKPKCLQLLPLVPDPSHEMSYHWDYIYEPDAKSLLTLLLTRYVESQVYQGVVENLACEQAARMLAMKNATESASDVIYELSLKYNKARQAAITKELAEIVSGAGAV